MSRALAAIGWILVSTVSCASLPDLEPGCGNGILEPGEDCDTGDPRCVACGWTCDPGSANDSGCSAIPAPRDGSAYTCGVDGFCHAPGGELTRPTSEVAFASDQIVVSDVDHDGYGDVLGSTAVSVVTRFGDSDGQLARDRDVLTPASTGSPSVSDVDGDGQPDLLIPARDGIVAYASPTHQLSSYGLAFPLRIGNVAVQPLAAFPVSGSRFGVLYSDNGKLAGAVFDALTQNDATLDQPVGFRVCDVSATSFEPDSLDSYNTSATTLLTSFAIAFVADGHTCVVETIVGSPTSNVYTFERPLDGRPVLAKIHDPSCPSLVQFGSDHKLGWYPATALPTGCTLAMSPSPFTFFPPGAVAVGKIQLYPNLLAFEPDALVLDQGAYAVTNAAGLVRLYQSDRPLTGAASGDVDGDGLIDAVVTGADATIDVLYRNATGFSRVRIATASPPHHVVVADFDGNGKFDISYVDHPGASEAIEIAYGTSDRPLPAIDVADVSDVAAALPLDLLDSNDRGTGTPLQGAIADLGVLDRRPGAPVILELHGSPDRDLIPYIDPRHGANTGGGADQAFRLVTRGRFGPQGTGHDLLSLNLFDKQPNAASGTPALWRIAESTPGIVEPVDGQHTGCADLAATYVSECSDTMHPMFCVNGARFAPWPLASSDLVVGIDPLQARALVLDPASSSYGEASQGHCSTQVPATAYAISPVPAIPPQSSLQAMFAADVDGDGVDELVVAFTAGATQGGVLACTVSASDVVCHDLIAQVPDLAGATCTAAAAGHLGLAGQSRAQPASGIDLAVECGHTLYRVSHDAAGLHALALAELPFVASALAVGDVTGDGVADVLASGFAADGVRRLAVFRQLTSREVPP